MKCGDRMKHNYHIKKAFVKKAVCLLTSAMMFASTFCFPEVVEYVKDIIIEASATSAGITSSETISSLKELYLFSQKYHEDPSAYCKTRLTITINENIVIEPVKTIDGVDYTFYPIGTQQYPFAGNLLISSNSQEQNYETTVPLFDYICDSVDFIYGNNQEEVEKLNFVRNTDTDTPLFANNVVHNTTSGSTIAHWDIAAKGSGSFSSVIGTVGKGSDGTQIDMKFTAAGTNKISSSGNAGLLFGTMTNNANATVDISASTGTIESITSNDGSAGGFVGVMQEGAELTVIKGSVDLSALRGNVKGKTFAGGIAGDNNKGNVIIKNAESDTTEAAYNAFGNITAETSAGGVFGKYTVPAGNSKFTSAYYTSTSGCTLSGKNVGGLVGELIANGSDITYSGTVSQKIAVKSKLSGAADNYGGIVGKYQNSNLTKAFTVEYVDAEMDGSSATNYGGVAASIMGDTPSYIKVDNFTLDSKNGADGCTYFGGVIGAAGSQGNLLDVGGIAVKTNGKTYKGGGVVGQLNSGVLRLSGVTNLTNAPCASGRSNGQIVGERINGLVYALGSGNAATASYGNDWRFIRSSDDTTADDIGTWGEVVRMTGVEGAESVFNFNAATHTVTVAAAATEMSSVTDFVKTAVNMQLNGGKDAGALHFANKTTSSKDSLLANKTLTVSGKIDLSGTGITGFMRDGSKSSDAEVGYFKGKLMGDSTAVIKLAVGERYGVLSSGTIGNTASTGRGAIHHHKFNGLFARTDDGAEIQNVEIGGFMNIKAGSDDIYVGGAAAYIHNNATFTSVDAKETINYYNNNKSRHYIGGVAGITECDAQKTVSIKGADSSDRAVIAPVINVSGTGVNNEGDKGDKTVVNQAIGGAIGYIKSVAGSVENQTETELKFIVLSAKIDASGASVAANVSAAGLVADIAWNKDAAAEKKDTRKLTLNDIDVKETVVKTNATNSMGGILGYRWYGTDVEMSEVKLSAGSSANEINTPANYISGLVYRATGNWNVGGNGITINSISFKNENAAAEPNGLSMLVYDGYYSDSGIFLEFTSPNSYSLADNLTIPTMSGKVYDELVACLSADANGLLTNNTAGVVSYYTSGGIYTSGEGTKNSYDNVYNKTVVNIRSRYYYNADRESFANSNDDGCKLLSWSLDRYAAKNIKRCFDDPFNGGAVTGNFDLKNISYYPIDIETPTKIGESTFAFYNNEIETAEKSADTKRGTRDGNSQHYMMHTGLFRNVTASITTTGNLAFYGSVGVNSTYSGALINGTLTGSLNTSSDSNISIGYYKNGRPPINKPLVLSDPERYMFINSIGDNAVLDLNGLYIDYNGAYDTTGNTTYASSLIGNVVGKGISLSFSKLSIDARNSENVVTALDRVYFTTRSIFKNATLLNKYDVDSTSSAVYNFAQTDDWQTATARGGNVTYGRELSDSVMYEDEEKQYYDDDRNYINPESTPSQTKYEAGFSTNFLPYVRYFTDDKTVISDAPDNAAYMLREIKVNVLPYNLEQGCGTYDHPYEITNVKQLVGFAEMLDNGNDPMGKISLPVTKNNTHWCMDNSSAYTCKVFEYDGSQYYTAAGTTTKWTVPEVRKYLASAYYIVDSLTIESKYNFKGIGGFDTEYAFKGVIVGKNASTTITNKSGIPFIKVSNGSVVKRLIFSVDNKRGTTHFPVIYNAGSIATLFRYSENDLVYGGVIGKIMGGDNIIDGVKVTYENEGYIQVSGSSHYLYCVGGYVGAIVNGGLVFRNMSADSFTNKSSFKVNTSLSSAKTTNWAAEEDTKASHSHLYINPYIGRVINGYAINETTTYSGDSEKYTLDNSTKNYQIADVKVNVTDAEKLYYDTFENKNRVNIPTGQSLFILSLITQSGAGTATAADGDYVYDIGYDGNTKYDDDSAAQNAATHLAQYDKVGSAVLADKTGDYALAAKDTNSSKKAVPYIISHYTKVDTSGNYPARMMTGNTEFMKLSTANGTYNLPKGFRGIGSICQFKQADVDGKYTMKIYGFDGNNSKVNIDLTYNTYTSDKDNYSKQIYGVSTVYVGFGLFNYLVQKPKGDDRTSYYLDDGYYIGKFTISGSVTVNEYNDSGERQSGEGQNNDNNRKRMPAAAFVAGTGHEKYLNLYRLDLEDVTVTGSSNVAGYIGRNNIAENNVQGNTNPNDKVYVFVNACNTTGTKLVGSGGSCGGIVGHSRGGYIDLFVNTAPNGNTADTERRGDDGYFKSTMELDIKNDSNFAESGCGGILGGIRNGYQVHLWVNNVTISGYTDTSKIENTSTSVASSLPSGAGGMFGYVRKAESVIITNCVVKDISVTGPVAGGLFGNIDLFDDKPQYGVSPKIKIYNTKVYAEEKNKFSINGVAFSGGLAGQFISSKTYTSTVTGYNGNSFVYDIDGCEVYNYTITQTSSDDKQYGAGGMIGYAKQAQRTIVNSRVHDCTIKANADNNKHGMGGVVGNSEFAIWGYNIAAYNNSFEYLSDSGKTLARYGSFIGNSNSKELKIVGFTRKNNNLGNTAVSQDWGNGAANGSYIIDADYMNISTTNAHNTAMAVGFDNGTNVGEGASKNYFPYVTVSPKVKMGGDNFLTGDGVSIHNNSPLAKLIVAENKGTAAENRLAYKTVNNTDIEKVQELINYGEDTTKDNDIKLTTYYTEMGRPEGYTGDDFPIIAINGAQMNYNEYINAYIRTLTNTTDSYTANIAGKFKVDIYPCQCINGVYQRVSGTPGFQKNNNNFVMVDSAADSVAKYNQISMIDISFLDPTDKDKTAYHLYVPVLTKKLLKFTFSSSALQGTEYEPTVYRDKFPESFGEISKLAGSFDSWQTVFVQFDYSKYEMDKFLETGKGLKWNTTKTLYLSYSNSKNVAQSTQFVLLDNNNNADKEYYAAKSDIRTEQNSTGNSIDVIDFGAFTTTRDKAATVESTQFKPQNLMDIAAERIVYTPDDDAGEYVECSESEATVYSNNNGTKKYFKEYTSGLAARYKLTVSDVVSETYYLSMYTYGKDNNGSGSTNSAYAFTVGCPTTFTSSVITCQKSAAKDTLMFLGNFMKQTLTLSDLTAEQNISTQNHTLDATLISTVEFDGDFKFFFHTNLQGETIYQGYFLYLNRHDRNGSVLDSEIRGEPTYTVVRKVNGETQGDTESSYIPKKSSYLYISPISIVVPEYSDNWVSTQRAEVSIDFAADDTILNDEFPTRSASDDFRGIGIDATAKLDFTAARVSYSNNIADVREADNRYYISKLGEQGQLTLTALEQPANDEYDEYGEQSHNKSALGINAKYIDTGKKYSEMGDLEHIEAGMDYDVSNLPDEVFDGNHNLVLTIALEQKNNSSKAPGYVYSGVNIEDSEDDKGYLENFKLISKGSQITLTDVRDGGDGYLYYTYTMPLTTDKSSWTIDYTDTGVQKLFTANVQFNARTNKKLEAIEGYKYANYRLKMTAEIRGGNDSYISTDWIVYTNAKVNAQYVKAKS